MRILSTYKILDEENISQLALTPIKETRQCLNTLMKDRMIDY